MTGRSVSSLRIVVVMLAAALALSSCGVFGGDDAAASAQAPGESTTVRVASGDRFFDIDPSSLVDENGDLTSAALSTLDDRVSGLSLGDADPTNAGIIFDGSNFVVNPSIPGSSPDIDALAAALLAADGDALDMPFLAIEPDVTDEDAAEYADQLNERLVNGLDVAVGGEKETLSTSALGQATTVEWNGSEWVVSIDYAGLAEELDSMFPNVGGPGGEATFTVEPGVGDEPGTVVIVPGAPATACCDEASVNRIIAAITSELDTATLTLANVDGERGEAWAESLGINELVGSFTTRYTAGQSRNINIERIAELTQGHIIEPGETWSLNERVGQRTRANGFVPAGTIVNGHLTDSVGGGISQYATTIFNAAFFAGLEFDEYQAHSIYFSRYPYGREATISWPAPQLEIYNPTPYGILIWPTTTENSITVDLYSTRWVEAEQTGQSESTVQVACTRVTTERTRTFLDGTVDVDSVFAIYRQEGIGCDGEATEDPDAPPTTTTTTIPEGEEPEDGEGDDAADGEETPTAPTPTEPEEPTDAEPADPGAGQDPADPAEPEPPAEEPVEPPAEPEDPAEEPAEPPAPTEEPIDDGGADEPPPAADGPPPPAAEDA